MRNVFLINKLISFNSSRNLLNDLIVIFTIVWLWFFVKGSDIAAGTAAALAAGSIVFLDNGDTDYSQELLTAAESLYSFAKANR